MDCIPLPLGDKCAIIGKQVVFIGSFVNCKRRDAVAIVEVADALCRSKVNRRTDIIVSTEGVVRDSQQCVGTEAAAGEGLLVVGKADFLRYISSIRP
jgi:hypothetical protein